MIAAIKNRFTTRYPPVALKADPYSRSRYPEIKAASAQRQARTGIGAGDKNRVRRGCFPSYEARQSGLLRDSCFHRSPVPVGHFALRVQLGITGGVGIHHRDLAAELDAAADCRAQTFVGTDADLFNGFHE